MGACASAPRESASELAMGPHDITSGSSARDARAASKCSKREEADDARRGRDTRFSDSPAEKHEAPRSESLAAIFGTSDATRRRDASLIRPSDAFESPDRIATGVSLPQRDRRDSARSSTPKSISRRTSARPIRTPPPGPGGSPSTRATPSPRCAPASSPPTSRYAGWDMARTARCIAGTTSSADGCGAQEDQVAEDGRRHAPFHLPRDHRSAEPETPKRGRAPRRGGGRRSGSRGEGGHGIVRRVSPSSSSSTIWRVCSAPPDVADATRADETRGSSTLLRARALSRAWGVAPRRQGE